jgi:hypothetical protein
MAKETDLTRRVYRYYWDHPGMNYHYKDVADSLGMGTVEEIGAVNAALTRAESRHPEYGIRRVGAGTYRFNPVDGQPDTPAKDAKLYEFIGFMPNQDDDEILVVRDDENVITLWRKVKV